MIINYYVFLLVALVNGITSGYAFLLRSPWGFSPVFFIWFLLAVCLVLFTSLSFYSERISSLSALIIVLLFLMHPGLDLRNILQVSGQILDIFEGQYQSLSGIFFSISGFINLIAVIYLLITLGWFKWDISKFLNKLSYKKFQPKTKIVNIIVTLLLIILLGIIHFGYYRVEKDKVISFKWEFEPSGKNCETKKIVMSNNSAPFFKNKQVIICSKKLLNSLKKSQKNIQLQVKYILDYGFLRHPTFKKIENFEIGQEKDLQFKEDIYFNRLD